MSLYFNKDLWIRASSHMLTRLRKTHWPILMFKECFCLRYSFVTFRVPGTYQILVPILITVGRQDRQNRALSNFSCLGFFWKVPLDIFNNIQKKKGKLYRTYCPLADKWPLTLEFYLLFILIDYFVSCPWNEEIVESSGRNNTLHISELDILIPWYWPYPKINCHNVTATADSSSTIFICTIVFCNWISSCFSFIHEFEYVIVFSTTVSRFQVGLD